MKSSSCVRAVALAAAVMIFAAPAMAQITDLNQLSEAQQDEMHCVATSLAAGDGFYDVVDAFLYDDITADQLKAAEAALKTAGEACTAAYGWDAGKQALGEKIGIYASTADYLAEDLFVEGLEDEEIDLAFAALEKLSVEDLNRFLDDSWLEDAGFTKRVNDALVAAKFPADDEYVMETARLFMEASVLTSAVMSDWVRAYINKP